MIVKLLAVLVPECKMAGGMAEWFKAAVLKTVERKFRGFKSYSLRQINCWPIKWTSQRRDDREAEGARLLSECGA